MPLATFWKRKAINMKSDKKKKKKVTYVDDGSTIFDMSGVGGGRPSGIGKGTAKERFATYMKAVKQMFVPMLVTMAAISIVFGIVYLLLTLAE